LRTISQALNRLAFSFRSSLRWRPKYLTVEGSTSYALPSYNDLRLLERFVTPSGSNEERAVLDAAIDWFIRANSAGNVFTRFLGYYISLESTAISMSAEGTDFGFEYRRPPPGQRREVRLSCIQELHDKLYGADPTGFVTSAYFDCIQSLGAKMRGPLQLVFGEGSPYLQSVLGPSHGKKPLAKLRNDIVHGRYSMSEPAHLLEVSSRISEVREIAGQFLARLMLRLKPHEEIPTGRNVHMAGISFDDPRGLRMADPITIASKDWRIRPEWCD
jgi:hypothetical protein